MNRSTVVYVRPDTLGLNNRYLDHFNHFFLNLKLTILNKIEHELAVYEERGDSPT